VDSGRRGRRRRLRRRVGSSRRAAPCVTISLPSAGSPSRRSRSSWP
jgi:hypothetical protein